VLDPARTLRATRHRRTPDLQGRHVALEGLARDCPILRGHRCVAEPRVAWLHRRPQPRACDLGEETKGADRGSRRRLLPQDHDGNPARAARTCGCGPRRQRMGHHRRPGRFPDVALRPNTSTAFAVSVRSLVGNRQPRRTVLGSIFTSAPLAARMVSLMRRLSPGSICSRTVLRASRAESLPRYAAAKRRSPVTKSVGLQPAGKQGRWPPTVSGNPGLRS